MDRQTSQLLTAQLSDRIRGLGMIAAALLLCNGLLGFFFWHATQNKEIIIMPAGLTAAASISRAAISNEYLEAMALMIAGERLNLSPATVDAAANEILTFAAPAYYADLREQLIAEAALVKKKQVSAAFFVVGVRSNPADLSVNVRGTLRSWLGGQLISSEPKQYRLEFSQTGLRLGLSSFKETGVGSEG